MVLDAAAPIWCHPAMPDQKQTPNRLRYLRLQRGLTQAALAQMVGTSQQQIKRLERGERRLTDQWIYKLAEHLGCRPDEILLSSNVAPDTSPIVPIAIRGIVRAGHWDEAAEFSSGDWDYVQVPRPDGFTELFGLRVRGRSMDIDYPPGSILVCAPIHSISRAPRHGDHLIIHRTRADGLVEATVKELRVDEQGRCWLWPKSTQPEHQAPIPIPETPADADLGESESIEIAALVVADYRVRAQ